MKAVLFDAAGTLLRVRGSVGAVYLEHARRYGFDSGVSAGELGEAFVSAFRSQPPLAFSPLPSDAAEALELDWWRGLVRRVFEPYGPFPRFEDFFADLFAAFATDRHWELEPGCEELLRKLRKRGSRLAVVSNFDVRLFSVLQELGIAQFFDEILVSSRCRTAKPEPEIFRLACRQVGCEADQAMHVGDSPVEDVQGARRAGLRAVLYDPGNRFPGFEGERVARLTEVLELTADH